MEVGRKKDEERRAMDGLDSDFLEFIGLGRSQYSKWKGDQDLKLIGPNKKRGPTPKFRATTQTYFNGGKC